MRQELRDGSKAEGGGAFNSILAVIGVSCPVKGSIRTSVVTIGLQSGAVTDPDTRKFIETPDAARLAIGLLANKQKVRDALQKDVQAACRPQ
jgi:uncharacterized membrane protein